MSAAMLAPDFLGMQALILYYARKELYHHVATVATTALQKRANDASLLFWRAYATLKEGHLSDAVRELDALRSRHGVQLHAERGVSSDSSDSDEEDAHTGGANLGAANSPDAGQRNGPGGAGAAAMVVRQNEAVA